MTQAIPIEWHPQDWPLVAEALVDYAGPSEGYDAGVPKRIERARMLVEAIADPSRWNCSRSSARSTGTGHTRPTI